MRSREAVETEFDEVQNRFAKAPFTADLLLYMQELHWLRKERDAIIAAEKEAGK